MAPILAYIVAYHLGFAVPMLVGTVAAALSFVCAIALGPETKGEEFVPDMVVA